ncbi:MAG: hypothetical protein HFJ58_02115 [Clostridia bacterium]|nr:hypothetical protein [Clostridia bacterium]
MEYAKDEIFSIRYNEKKDKLEYSFFRRFLKRILNNKFMTLLIIMGVLFSALNFTLIYCFFEVLSRI